MPRAYDNGFRPELTNDPSRNLAMSNPLGAIDALDAMAEALNNLIKEVWRRLAKLLGLSVPDDFKLFDPAEFFALIGKLGSIPAAVQGIIDTILHALGVSGSGFDLETLRHHLEDAFSGLVGAVTAIFDPSWLSNIVAGQIGSGKSKNLLTNGTFTGDDSLLASDGWTYDGSVGHASPGSATCTADGVRHVMTSNAVTVSEGQTVTVDGWVKWAGVSASGSAFTLLLTCYLAGSVVGENLVGEVASPAASGGFTHITGADYVVPAGVDEVRVRFTCEAAVTAGQVWWDDLSAVKSGTIQQGLITGLPQALNTIISDAQAFIDRIVNSFGTAGSGFTLPQLGDVLQSIPSANIDGLLSLFTKVQDIIDRIMNGFGLFGSGFSLGSLQDQIGNVFTTSSSIPQSNVNGLASALGGLLPVGQWNDFIAGLTGSAGSGSSGGTGIPAVDDALNALAGLFGTAQTTENVVNAQTITTGVIDGMTFRRTVLTSSGTWNQSAIPSGYTKRVKVSVACINAGQNGRVFTKSQNTYNYKMGNTDATGIVTYITAPPTTARGGGYIQRDFTIADAGTSKAVTVGASNGAVSSFGSLLSGQSGVSSVMSTAGALPSSCAPGNGGQGGPGNAAPNPGSGVAVYGSQAGGDGGSSGMASGGAGASAGGNGSAGAAGGSDSDGLLYYGGGGGGGGGASGGNAGNGGNGGFPGGAGGTGTTGGTGASGAVIIWEWFA